LALQLKQGSDRISSWGKRPHCVVSSETVPMNTALRCRLQSGLALLPSGIMAESMCACCARFLNISEQCRQSLLPCIQAVDDPPRWERLRPVDSDARLWCNGTLGSIVVLRHHGIKSRDSWSATAVLYIQQQSEVQSRYLNACTTRSTTNSSSDQSLT
jgi:hypothetical protein